jgi:hypothetical protein
MTAERPSGEVAIVARNQCGRKRADIVFKRSMPSDLIRGWIPVRVKKTRQKKEPQGRLK